MANSVTRSREGGDPQPTYPGGVLLRAKNLRKAFGGQVVLNDVSVELRRGEVVLLRGDNGSGKTTLLNILTGNLEPDTGTIDLFTNGVAERFRFPRRFWQDLNPWDHFTPERVARESVGRTWQEIRLFSSQSLLDNVAVSHPRQRGENPIAVLLRGRTVRRQEAAVRSQSAALLTRFGLGDRTHSSADMISLGQSKRVAIIRAIQAGAKILFLDEPLAGLDAQGVRGIMALLEQLARDHDITLVIVEHVFNIPHVLQLADTVWTLRNAHLNIQAPKEVDQELERNGNQQLDFVIRNLSGPGHNVRTQSLPGGAVLTTITQDGVDLAEPVLEIKDLVVRRARRLVIGENTAENQVRGFSLCMHRGEIAFLQAPNGWGKTTLVEAIAGLIPIAGGQLFLNGKSIEKLPSWHRAALGLSLLQARNHTFGELSVKDALRMAGNAPLPLSLRHLLNRNGSDLSGGEKQKLAIVRARATSAACMMMDEPFSALDQQSIAELTADMSLGGSMPLLIAVPSQAQDN